MAKKSPQRSTRRSAARKLAQRRPRAKGAASARKARKGPTAKRSAKPRRTAARAAKKSTRRPTAGRPKATKRKPAPARKTAGSDVSAVAPEIRAINQTIEGPPKQTAPAGSESVPPPDTSPDRGPADSSQS